MLLLTVLKNFLNSEKAMASFVVLAAATAFVFTGDITVQEWMDYSKWILGIYVGGKSIQGAAAAVSGGSTNRVQAATDMAAAARNEVAALKKSLGDNDAAADAALADKENDEDE